jgi:hypothetical protein
MAAAERRIFCAFFQISLHIIKEIPGDVSSKRKSLKPWAYGKE